MYIIYLSICLTTYIVKGSQCIFDTDVIAVHLTWEQLFCMYFLYLPNCLKVVFSTTHLFYQESYETLKMAVGHDILENVRNASTNGPSNHNQLFTDCAR